MWEATPYMVNTAFKLVNVYLMVEHKQFTVKRFLIKEYSSVSYKKRLSVCLHSKHESTVLFH